MYGGVAEVGGGRGERLVCVRAGVEEGEPVLGLGEDRVERLPADGDRAEHLLDLGRVVDAPHDDGPLAEGEFEQDGCTVECPRHGSLFDLRTGKPLNLPAYVPIDTFPVLVENGTIRVEVD